MSEYTKDEAVAFIEALRLTLNGRVGFKWLDAKLTLLGAYIDAVSAENERLNAFIDSAGLRDDYEAK